MLGHLVDRIPGRPVWLALAGLFVVAALLLGAWMISGPLIDELTHIERNRLPRITQLQAARNADLRASLSLRNALLLKDPDLRAQELVRYHEAAAIAEHALRAYRQQLQRREELAMLDNVLTAREITLAARRGAIEGLQRGDEPQAVVPLLEAAITPYLDALSYLQEDMDNRTKTVVDVLGLRSQTLRLLLTAAGLAATLTVLLIGWSSRNQMLLEVRRREQRIADLQAQKQNLVREVHHRIKNHLQGLLALLDLHRQASDTKPSDALGTLQGQVMALIGLHGLQAASGEDGLSLTRLVRDQVALVRAGFPDAEVTIREPAGVLGTIVPGEQAVSIALVVTELLVNAMKHGSSRKADVCIEREKDGTTCVSVANQLAKPVAFDLAAGTGLGTGLKLAQSLALDVAELTQRQHGNEVEMKLRLLCLVVA